MATVRPCLVLDSERLARSKTQELFLSWLAREETAAQVDEWLRLAAEGGLEPPPPREKALSLGDLLHHAPRAPLARGPTSPTHGVPAGPARVVKHLPSPLRRGGMTPAVTSELLRPRSASLENEEALLVERWKAHHRSRNDDGDDTEDSDPLPASKFAPFAAEFCDLPAIAGTLIFNKIECDTKVSLEQFLRFWRSRLRNRRTRADRLFAVLASTDAATSLEAADLEPLLRNVVTTHPGLAFLAEHAEFQAKYSSTVVTRVFYRANVSRTGAISRREFRDASPDIVEALFKLESTDDVNAETGYFSYEHFYVLYCQFWELDADKDAKLTRTDLLKYGGHRLSRAIVDRVFDAAPRPFSDGKCGATLRRKSQSGKASLLRRVASSNQPFLSRRAVWAASKEEEDEEPRGRTQQQKEGGGFLRRNAQKMRLGDDDDDDACDLDLDDDLDVEADDRSENNDDDDLLGKLAAAAASRLPEDDDPDEFPKPMEEEPTHDALTYEDFVYFMLSEEDKGNEAALRYWFACVDVDGDGVIDARDAKHFYDVQAQRMECLGHEVVPLDDVLCQMADLLNADDAQQRRKKDPMTLTVELSDFVQPSKIRVAGVFFDALFSLDKFVAFEQRDPFAERLKRDDPFDNEWDRFAASEYSRLATEDDDDDDDDDHNARGDCDHLSPNDIDADDSGFPDTAFDDDDGLSLGVAHRIRSVANEAPF